MIVKASISIGGRCKGLLLVGILNLIELVKKKIFQFFFWVFIKILIKFLNINKNFYYIEKYNRSYLEPK